MALRRDQTILLWACVAALAVWVVAPLRFLLLPLIYYNTHIHELCHALATVLSGGSVGAVEVYASGSGATFSRGGSLFLIASAGYVGSTIVGGLMVFGSRTWESARRMLWVAFWFLAVGMALFVRGDVVGVLSGFAWLAALGAGARWLKGDGAVFATQFLGAQLCLTSAHSFFVLLQISAGNLGHSDAANMQDATGIPAILWAVGWLAFSLFVVGLGLHRAWHNRP
jgi:hypothetical protein